MSRPRSFFAYAALLAGVVAFASSFARPLTAQQGATSAPAVGRYQMVVGNGNLICVTDTATGHTWAHGSVRGTSWEDLGTPPSGK